MDCDRCSTTPFARSLGTTGESYYQGRASQDTNLPDPDHRHAAGLRGRAAVTRPSQGDLRFVALSW
jgi:hypothetical protein